MSAYQITFCKLYTLQGFCTFFEMEVALINLSIFLSERGKNHELVQINLNKYSSE